jgi:hypothetical protein
MKPLDSYPTPETDDARERIREDINLFVIYELDSMACLARDLERRLALCRAALEFYADTEDDDGRIATEALTATAPK